VVLLLIVSAGGWWYLSQINGEPSLPGSCGSNEIKALDGECVPKPPSVSELVEQVEYIEKRLDDVQEQLGNDSVQALTVKLDAVQRKIESIQEHINNTPESYEVNVLQEQLDEQQKRKILMTEMLFTDKNVPMCLLSASTELQKKLPMFLVPAVQRRAIPKDLRIWMRKIADSTIDESAFFVMRREVTVGEFQYYVDTLDNEQRANLGDTWQQEDGEFFATDNPVASVFWWAAKGYADWLSEQTGCLLTLPTYNQWVTATIRYDANPADAVIRETLGQKPRRRDENPSSVVDLLGNLREWSIDSQRCGTNSHYLLGEDYKTYQDNIIGEPICESSTLDTVGFRLVVRERE